jgi:hypothetical protein
MTYVAGPFDAEHYYLQWGGTLPGGEIFSCGMRMATNLPGNPALPDITDDYVNNIGGMVAGFHQTPQANISPTCILTYVKLNVIKVDGTYKYPQTHEYTPVGIPGGGNGSPQYPNQVALAVTLITDYTRGPAHSGRFYMPLPAIPVAVDGRITADYAGGVRAAASGLITTINNNAQNAYVAVFSRKAGAPAHRQVTGTRVGRVLDTQRRRRSALPESYVIAP